MKTDFNEIVRHFEFKGDFSSAEMHGVGHINDTYLARFTEHDLTNYYILQRINNQVFHDPEGLMSNIQGVTQHLRQKINLAGGDPDRETLTLVPSRNGNCFIQTDTGDYWRGYHYIDNARTYETAENIEQVYQAARTFGNFQDLLMDYPSQVLIETIPDFHNTSKRFENFLDAVEQNVLNRAQASRPEIEFVLNREKYVSILVNELKAGQLPERVTHNDTKFNNVLIDDQTGEGVCVIDLDTVMPGLTLYDFGDAIRSLSNSGAEDERDLAKVRFDLQVFDVFTRGYLESVGDMLTSQEKDYLPLSAVLMTLECGTRFLTDYLLGDHYFKIQRAGQNLDRCRTQFKLVADMENQFDAMQKIVEKYR